VLYHFLVPLSEYHIVFNLFRFQTFRAAGAVVTAFLVAFYLGPPIIRRLRILKVGQVVRSEGPQTHLGKSGTPTMGGVLIVLSTVIPTLLWAELTNGFILISLGVLVWLGALGFMDDYLKVVRKKTEGLVGRYKIVGQASIGLLLGGLLIVLPLSDVPATWTQIPFFKTVHVNFFWPAYVFFVAFIITGSSNAVNLTDGLDGLAAGLSAIAAATFGIFA
jgi:phospho-N-acetylmuramoyl-pentapeptide-transferase